MNIRQIIIPFFMFALASLLASCGETAKKAPDVSHIPGEVKIIRWDQELRNCKTDAELEALLNKYPAFSDYYLSRAQVGSNAPLVANIKKLQSSVYYDSLNTEADFIYTQEAVNTLQEQFTQSFKLFKHYYPQIPLPHVYFVMSEFSGDDIYVKDSMIVVAIEYFFGPQSRFRPPVQQNYYDYVLQRYDLHHMVPNILFQLSNSVNQIDPTDKTLMGEMIAFGKAHYFAEALAPYAPDSVIIGYTEQQMIDIDYNLEKIWAHFIDQNMFFVTDAMIKSRYIGERPNVTEVADQCPGRIGRWLGWQFVRSYAKNHPDVGLPQLMANKNAQQIFQESKFKPKQP